MPHTPDSGISRPRVELDLNGVRNQRGTSPFISTSKKFFVSDRIFGNTYNNKRETYVFLIDGSAPDYAPNYQRGLGVDQVKLVKPGFHYQFEVSVARFIPPEQYIGFVKKTKPRVGAIKYTYHANPNYEGHWGTKAVEKFIGDTTELNPNLTLSNKKVYKNYTTPNISLEDYITNVTSLLPTRARPSIEVERANVLVAQKVYSPDNNRKISGPELFANLTKMYDLKLVDGKLEFTKPSGTRLAVNFDEFAGSLRGNPGVTKEEFWEMWSTSVKKPIEGGAFIGTTPTLRLDASVWNNQIRGWVELNNW